MGIRLSPFYPVVPDACGVRQMIDAGAGLVQLRLKNTPRPKILQQVREAVVMCRQAGSQLVVNDHWQEALEFGAGFVHLGQDDLRDADLPALRRRGVCIGVSTHDEAELERALFVTPAYVALGPIWPTTVKVMPCAPQGVARLAEWKRRMGKIPLVAIGGITLPRLAACLGGGADAVAVVNDVMGAADPVSRARQWVKAVERHA